MEDPVAAALVLTHHADRPEASFGVAADRPVVRRRRVDGDAVVTALLEQEPGQQRDGLAPCALALEAAAEEDIDSGVPVHRGLLLVVLDAPGDFSLDLHYQHDR